MRVLRRLVVVCAVLAALSAASAGAEQAFATPYTLLTTADAAASAPGMVVRGAVMLHPARLAAPRPHEMSALAWDADAELLYAVTDNGLVVHLAPRFADGELVDVAWRASFPLRDAGGTPLSGHLADAEAVVARRAGNGIRGDTELVIAFERVPRLARYDVEGRLLGTERLPRALAEPARYAGDNLQIEALTEHPALGLVMAPERPLRGTDTADVTLYGAAARRWQLPAFDREHGSVVALETMPDGALLLLERRFVKVFFPIRFALSRLELSATGGVADVRRLAVLDNTAGWAVDNFEGIAHHRGRCYFMVSDDNAHLLQHTLLVYFELRDPAPAR
ncbi:MAG: esterase-like activity of phytase family protein [Gammaproteobacteria bacterium]